MHIRLNRLLSMTVAASVLSTILVVPPALAKPVSSQPGAQLGQVLNGVEIKGRPSTPDDVPRATTASAPVWPAATLSELTLPASGARVADSPVSVAPVLAAAGARGASAAEAVAKVSVQTFDHYQSTAAGINGVLMRLGRADGVSTLGASRVTVDYSGFAQAYGGDWASRLRLVQLPACALTTPHLPGCQGTPLNTSNSASAKTLTADVAVAPAADSGPATTRSQLFGSAPSGVSGGTLVAAMAASGGGAGDFAASNLSSSGTWSAGGNSGGFSWDYNMRVPPSLGGPAPSVGIAYSSASVDGLMSVGNPQTSWIGEGFSWGNSFVERSFHPCADDKTGGNNSNSSGDWCWLTRDGNVVEAITMSLNGSSGELLQSADGRWHLRSDDGSKIERRTTAANGDDNGEWWVVTTTNGTEYWFGTKASSTQVQPVAGNHPGEPCRQSSFTASFCNQAYRWNLDYVVDLNGNTMTYVYTEETGKYGRYFSSTDVVTYDRFSYLSRIEYGTRAGDSTAAPMVVEMTTAERCLSSCWAGTPWQSAPTKANWLDTPLDQDCTGSPCNIFTPTYWGMRRLTKITTKLRADATGSTYNPVESWTLTQSFVAPQDGTSPRLWLDRISHAAADGTATPDISFIAELMPNRVDPQGADRSPMNWGRIKRIITETGGEIVVTYAAPATDPHGCVPGVRMPSVSDLHNNGLRCYPVKWDPGSGKITEFFHKYLVASVSEQDNAMASPSVITSYEYLGSPAWHYTDDNGLVKAADKTWSVWRGYGAVRTYTGAADKPSRTMSEVRYFRGMHDDQLPSGKRVVAMPAVNMNPGAGDTDTTDPWDAPAVDDLDVYAGMTRETIVYNGPGGAEVKAQVFQPWQSGVTASRTIGTVTVDARFVGANQAQWIRVTRDQSRASMVSSSRSWFDGYGMPVKAQDDGDSTVSGDEQCALTEYARSTTKWILEPVRRGRTYAADCQAVEDGALTEENIMSDTVIAYDGKAVGEEPTIGRVTETKEMKTWAPGTPPTVIYQTKSRAAYDVYGRVKETWDIDNNYSKADYTHNAGGQLASITETNPLTWTSTTTIDPRFGATLSSVDYNLRRTDAEYDGLGRILKVWQPAQSKAMGHTPSAAYTYDNFDPVGPKPMAITTKVLNTAGTQVVASVAIYDGLGRAKQVQAPAKGTATGQRLISEKRHDSAGRVDQMVASYLIAGAPSRTPYTATAEDQAKQTKTSMVFDGLNRVLQKTLTIRDAVHSRSSTLYTGDRMDVTPAAGATATSLISDITGRLSEARQYHGTSPTPTVLGSYDATTYHYDRKGQLTRTVDALGNQWENQYNLLGQRTKVIDPNAGTTETTYYDNGLIKTAKDANNEVLAYHYDALGRRDFVRDDDPLTGAPRASWHYDSLAKGMLTKSVRYEGTAQYVSEILAYNTRYQPIRTRLTVPAIPENTGISGTYTYDYGYNATDGSLSMYRLPAIGGLALETLNFTYDGMGMPLTMTTNLGGTYVTGTTYTEYGEPNVITMRNNGGAQAYLGQYYEEGTRHLAEIRTTHDADPTISDLFYERDEVGNITKIADTVNGDTQCFDHDYLIRLREAWTPGNGDCNAAPTAAGLGGPAKYWTQWNIDKIGNRKEQIQKASGSDITTSYLHPNPGLSAVRPHSLSSTSVTGVPGSKSYTYDNAGNTRTRPTDNAGTQTLDWDAEGKLAKSSDSTGATTYVYDAEGNRLIRRDPAGKTLYLVSQELRYANANGGKTATRFYSHAGQPIASRTNAGLTWLSSDNQGTANVAMNAAGTFSATIRRQDPYGNDRGQAVPWVNDKGYLGGTKENTGLTHLGARDYDPGTGRFVSTDPVRTLGNPQQWNPYSYSENSPVVKSDASGECAITARGQKSICNLWCIFGCEPPKDKDGDGSHSLGEIASSYVDSNCYSSGGAPSGIAMAGAKAQACQAISTVYGITGDVVGEFSGFNDGMRCFEAHDLGSCAWFGFQIVSSILGKAGSMVKAADLAHDIAKGVKAVSIIQKAKNALTSLKNMITLIKNIVKMFFSGLAKLFDNALEMINKWIDKLNDLLKKLTDVPLGPGPKKTPKPPNPTTPTPSAPGTSGGATRLTAAPYRADGQIVFHGHGEWDPASGFVVIPDGTWLAFYGEHGDAIMQGKAIMMSLGTGPGPIQILGPGKIVPNYTLSALGPKLKFVDGAKVVDSDTLLSELIAAGKGVCHWGACRRSPSTPMTKLN